ncbi:MAG: O-antigen ligase family protein [Syntrophobacteraceae bacterium]|jgi:O-antigen ligase|nr:O-antigen ligase family protein [Syntrophobacteraceae bacterium]
MGARDLAKSDAGFTGGRSALLPWVLSGIPAGLLFLVLGGLETRWLLLLLAAATIGLSSLFFQDKKRFYLVLFSSTISMGLVLHLGLKPGSIYRSTHAFLISITHIPLLVVVALHLGRCLQDGKPVFTTPAALGASAFLFAASTLSVLFSRAAPFGVLDLFALATSLAVFLGIANLVGDRSELKAVLAVIVASVAVQGIIAVAQYLSGSTLGLELFGAPKILQSYAGLSRVSRSGGTMGHPNSLALYMDLFLPLGLSLFLCPSLRGKRALIGLATLLGLMGLGATLSRGGLLATGFALTAVLLLHWRSRIGILRSSLVLLAVVTLAGIVILSTPNPIQKRFSKYDFGTAQGRYSLAGVAMTLIRENPLLGVGLNGFTEAARLVDDTPERIVSLWNAPVHNLFLFIAGETGLLGLTAFLLLLGCVLRGLGKPLRSEDPLIAYASLGALMGLTAFLIHGMVDYVHWTHFNPLWFLAGLALSLGRIAPPAPSD